MSAPTFEAPGIEEVHELLPAYDVLDFIAQGGMGAVYRARQISLDRAVAIKILPREFGEDADFRKSFEAEAKAMARLNHPNLIGVYDFGEVQGMPYIVMEFVDGKALHYSAHGKAIEQEEAARLTLGICEGLAHAHDAGILHRDIKPANILLDSKKRPKIGDFGLARPIESDDHSEMVFGTPGYSAPEIMGDSSKIDKRSDVYSTGVILYELLTGELPGEQYVPASKMADVDPRFDKIIRRATHPSPGMRFADAGAMADEVRKIVDALQKPGASKIVRGTVTAPAASGEAPPAPASPMKHAHVGTNWPLMRNIVIIVVLLAAIFGVWKAYQKKQENIAGQTQNALAEKEAHEQEQAAKRAAAAAAAKAEAEANRRPMIPEVAPEVINPIVEKPKTPLDFLEGMRSSLADGNRTVFPPGTLERGEARYFFVEKPLSWQEACAFAEQFGAHLVTLPSDSERTWLSTKIPANTSIWVGGGSLGRSEWGWIDGTEWTLRKPSTASGTAASLTDLGTLRAKPAGEPLPFFIQWNMEGTNPGSLEAQLERTTATLGDSNPVWPPGTVSFGARRYLVVVRPLTRDDGAALASLANAHLAVPSEQSENDFIKKTVAAAVPDGGGCWIGGLHNGRAWGWTTGEAWNFADWAPGSPDGNPVRESALRLLTGPDGGWDDASPSNRGAARACIFEWSKDGEAKAVEAGPVDGGDLARLRGLAKRGVAAKQATHKKEIRENGKSLVWDLDLWLRSLPEGPKAQWGPRILQVKQLIDGDGRFRLPRRKRIALPGQPVEKISYYKDRQARFDTSYAADLNNIRVKYIEELNKSRAKLLERGLKAQVQAFENEIQACGNDGKSFLEHITGERFPE
ncbi:MAG: protein kinase [Akkermansiaceae bacterium]|nr:protein kinase [Akkermansiaceae bacterium]NNM30792.1 protein kinase [Akkermansiaceae bacterium]